MTVLFQPLPVALSILADLLRSAGMNRQEHIDSQPGTDFDSVERARCHIKWRQRLLHRFRIDDDFWNFKKFALERKCRLRPRLADDFQGFGHDCQSSDR